MTLNKVLIGFITVTTLACTTVQAASINKREAAQRQSIRAGIQDGSLTRPEAHRLGKQQHRLERKEQHFRSDGELTRRERVNLQNTADNTRANIYRQRHDEQVRGSGE